MKIFVFNAIFNAVEAGVYRECPNIEVSLGLVSKISIFEAEVF